MNRSLPKELGALKAQREKVSQRIHYLEDREKILEHQAKEQTRRARTKRLCTRAGMLESFLRYPEALSDDEVMDLLRIAFRQGEVKKALNSMLANYDLQRPYDE